MDEILGSSCQIAAIKTRALERANSSVGRASVYKPEARSRPHHPPHGKRKLHAGVKLSYITPACQPEAGSSPVHSPNFPLPGGVFRLKYGITGLYGTVRV